MNDDVILFGCFRLFVAERLLEQSLVKLSGRALDTLVALVEETDRIADKRDTPDWSYPYVSEQERKVLRRFAIFDGIFTPEAARLVAPWDDIDEDEVAAVARLISESLVAVDGSDTTARLRLIDAMRTYATEKLADYRGGDQMAQRHAIYNLQVLEQANSPAVAPLADKRSRAAAMHLDNIRSALEWASSERGEKAVGAALAAAGCALAKDPEIAEELGDPEITEELGDLHNQLRQIETALREAERQHLDAQMQLAHANRIATMGNWRPRSSMKSISLLARHS